MAATNSAFRTETRDEHLYNHIELFNRSSSPIDTLAANRCQDCRGQHPTENQIATGRRVFGDYRTEPSNEHLYYNIQSINKPSSPATESQGANQTSQDDRRRQQTTGNSKTMGRRVASAMIAVLALTFLAMIASLIATTWVHADKSGTKNGCQLNQVKKEITQLVENLVKEKKTETRGLPEKKIGNKTTHEGCQDGGVLDDLKEQLNQVMAKITQLNESLVKEKKTEERLPEKKIGNKTTHEVCQDVTILNDMRQQLKEVLEQNLTDTVAKIIDKVSSNQIDECRRLEKDSKDPWIKMNESPICFGAGKNQFGRFNVSSSGTLASVKLVHVDGYVRCNGGKRKRSFWGCTQDPKKDVNVEIKKGADTAILPSSDFVVTNGEEESLQIPGYNSLSTELVLSANVSNPPQVTKGQRLRLSLREYSSARSEDQDNGEKSCCDVYARFT